MFLWSWSLNWTIAKSLISISATRECRIISSKGNQCACGWSECRAWTIINTSMLLAQSSSHFDQNHTMRNQKCSRSLNLCFIPPSAIPWRRMSMKHMIFQRSGATFNSIRVYYKLTAFPDDSLMNWLFLIEFSVVHRWRFSSIGSSNLNRTNSLFIQHISTFSIVYNVMFTVRNNKLLDGFTASANQSNGIEQIAKYQYIYSSRFIHFAATFFSFEFFDESVWLNESEHDDSENSIILKAFRISFCIASQNARKISGFVKTGESFEFAINLDIKCSPRQIAMMNLSKYYDLKWKIDWSFGVWRNWHIWYGNILNDDGIFSLLFFWAKCTTT